MRPPSLLLALIGFVLFAAPRSFSTALADGDQEFIRLNYPLALVIYDSLLTTTPDSAEVLWRLARLYVCIADTSPRDQKLDLYRRAEVFALRCIAADSTNSRGHTWRAAALGNMAMFEGGKSKVKLCCAIRDELDLSIRLNPGDDIAYSILGSFYMALGNVSWFERQLASIFLGSLPEGGYAESERALRRAIALAPNVIRHHFELGNLFVLLGRDKEAVAEFQQVQTLPVLVARDQQTRHTAAGLIKDLEEQ